MALFSALAVGEERVGLRFNSGQFRDRLKGRGVDVEGQTLRQRGGVGFPMGFDPCLSLLRRSTP